MAEPYKKPTDIKASLVRWKKHHEVIAGPQTVENFANSPYYRSHHATSPSWAWDAMQIHSDAVTLADEFLKEHEYMARY